MALSALASAILIVFIGTDAYRGHTAIGNRHIYRHRTPSLFWAAIMWYLAGAILIIAAGIYGLAMSNKADQACDPEVDESCAKVMIRIAE
ncbi:MAG: hypothetical protein KDD98_08670 [Sphingomonadaceae bacterium]|nr:hypothetical protein [Sphingomonadaceae bacterium]